MVTALLFSLEAPGEAPKEGLELCLVAAVRAAASHLRLDVVTALVQKYGTTVASLLPTEVNPWVKLASHGDPGAAIAARKDAIVAALTPAGESSEAEGGATQESVAATVAALGAAVGDFPAARVLYPLQDMKVPLATFALLSSKLGELLECKPTTQHLDLCDVGTDGNCLLATGAQHGAEVAQQLALRCATMFPASFKRALARGDGMVAAKLVAACGAAASRKHLQALLVPALVPPNTTYMSNRGVLHTLAAQLATTPAAMKAALSVCHEHIDGVDDNGETPLHAAAISGNVGAALALLEAGANVTATTPRHGTALHVAVKHWCAGTGDAMVLHLLGALPPSSWLHVVDGDGRTVLMHACKTGCYTVVRVVLAVAQRGGPAASTALCNVKDDGGMGALHLAALAGRVGAIELLVHAGAHVDMGVRHDRGESALDLAALGGHVPAFSRLLALGATVRVPSDGTNPTAFYHGAKTAAFGATIADALLQLPQSMQRGYQSELMHGACAGGNTALVCRLLQDLGASPHVVHQGGRSPMHTAAAADSVACMQVLLRAGARVDQVDDVGATPLHAAARAGSVTGGPRCTYADAFMSATT
jgi:ankyrin repeat protein